MRRREGARSKKYHDKSGDHTHIQEGGRDENVVAAKLLRVLELEEEVRVADKDAQQLHEPTGVCDV